MVAFQNQKASFEAGIVLAPKHINRHKKLNICQSDIKNLHMKKAIWWIMAND